MQDSGKNVKYERLMCFIFFLTWGFVFIDKLGINFMMPVISADLGLTNANIGQIGFVTVACYVVSSVVIGILSDKTGYRKRYLVPFIMLTGIGALCGILAQTYNQLLIARAVVGLGEGPILTLMMCINRSVSRPSKIGLNSGIVIAGAAVFGNFISPLVITKLVEFLPWRSIFAICSIPIFLIGIVILLVIKEVPVQASEVSASGEAKKAPLSGLLSNRNFILCSIIAILGLAGYWTLMLYVPVYLTTVSMLSTATMGQVSSGMGLLFIVYVMLIPSLSDRFGRKPLLFIGFIGALISPLCMFLFRGSFIGAGAYVLFGGIVPSLLTLYMNVVPMESLSDDLRGSGLSIVNSVGEFVGGALWPLLAGIIADASGLPIIMLIAAVLLGFGAVFSLALKETNPRIVAQKAKETI